MKNTIFLLFILCSVFFSSQIAPTGGGEYKFNESNVSCLTEDERAKIQSQLKRSTEILKKDKKISPINKINAKPKFIWPVRKSSTAPYGDVWAISNFIDHNKSFPNQILDWNCGVRSYDTPDGYNHQGIDIYLWPFSWQQLENNHTEIVAAADGIILYKVDGNYDRNCDFSNSNWNAVYVRHSDGSVAWYGHMKTNSLTSKGIGESVVAGEFLGVVGSSGNSTGPHLHFEVYDSNNELVETYQGSCNTFTNGNESWWAQQKPYREPRINSILTHSNAPDFKFNNCPQLEITNQSNQFSTGQNVIVAIYLADQVSGSKANIKIIRPNGIILYNFYKDLTEEYDSSYWYWTFPANNFNVNGKWKVEVTYNGMTRVHEFNYGSILETMEVSASDFEVYPNPIMDQLMIQSKNNIKIEKITLFDISGKMILSNDKIVNSIDVSNLNKGVYVVEITTSQGSIKKKVIKN